MMRKILCIVVLHFTIISAPAQTALAPLTVQKIMRDPKWIGSSPSAPQWSADGETLAFNWNPDSAPADSVYFIRKGQTTPQKATIVQRQSFVAANSVLYNQSFQAYTYSKDGDIFYHDVKKGSLKRITNTTDAETNPQFSFGETKIVYNRNQNIYAWDILTGETLQLTNIKTGKAPTSNAGKETDTIGTIQEKWLQRDQLQYFEVLKSRKQLKEKADVYTAALKAKEPRAIYIENKILQGLQVSPDGRFISYRLQQPVNNAKTTQVPNYVTETGFTANIPARTKVGAPSPVSAFYIFDRLADTVFLVKTDAIPGIKDIPAFFNDYPKVLEEKKKKELKRNVIILGPYWSAGGKYAVVDIRADDNKDRWLMAWDTASKQLRLLDRQHDEAWISGPGIMGNIGWLNENTCWFQSEQTGYSHLYTIDLSTNEKRQLTVGSFEVQRAQLSRDKKTFFITTNEVHPGEQHFYRLNIASGKKERVTTLTGAHQVTVSPDEKQLAVLYSYSTKPWELYLQENKINSASKQITSLAQSNEFKSYRWKDPEVISFPARDGATVYARLYKPATPHANKPAVVFVHGAGYLQNAHKWWSSYFREYLFNNMLADEGYYVLDIDYRGSAGYGRDWRTGIYRYMGGKDLSDHVDGVNYLVKNYGVNPAKIGVYGGSYGGFITLMGLFTEPGVFAAGAALRPVTDWANYNHPYTSNILNEPSDDSLAYRRSSPFYFAEGLKGHLLICHGMVDVNVHYQDAVKLTQRLIELEKDNWELASYPMEDHGFIEPSSWTDEYKRIFKLFETVLKQ